jgi:hypothetical protein
LEQHWAPLVHELPSPRHAPPLRLWHVPVPVVPHLPLQHCASLEHDAPSFVHTEA